MKHAIDPKVDCVFKALLGSPENSNLLVNFINAMLGEHLAHPVQQVEILNPYNEREFLNDKLSIVDIKAQDTEKQFFQVEIQLANFLSLPARILYNWADIYRQQLKSGEDYAKLKASYAIWLLNKNLYDDNDYLHHFQIRDDKGRSLIDHCHITLVELGKFHNQPIHNNQERWLQFFNQAESFGDNKLPEWMNTQEMQQAMNTLSRFSEQDREYFAYQARQEYIRQQNTIANEREQEDIARQKEMELVQQKMDKTLQEMKQTKQEMKQTRQEMKQTKQETEQAQQEMEQAQQEMEQEIEKEKQEKQSAIDKIAELEKLLAAQNPTKKS
ncbi:MAG: Rpn family recombination-promoting nuclease/putative transposase [Methyloprofundus sp.]|nr:Rpn family recombination-promoting nuclease/putative transposase [Methyloprofundus sp.]